MIAYSFNSFVVFVLTWLYCSLLTDQTNVPIKEMCRTSQLHLQYDDVRTE
jgi:hypothetical protein